MLASIQKINGNTEKFNAWTDKFNAVKSAIFNQSDEPDLEFSRTVLFVKIRPVFVILLNVH